METSSVSRSKGGLFSKVSFMLTASLLISALGTYLGQGIKSGAAMLVLMVLFLGGAICVRSITKANRNAGLWALTAWTFISGLFIGPEIHLHAKTLGVATVLLAYLGTAGVMAACGAIGAFANFNFRKLGPFLFIALLGLIVVGIVSIFVPLSHGVDLGYCIMGMIIFALFFMFDFNRLVKESEDTWENAVDLTMNIYLDYINFLLFFLRFLGIKNPKD